MEGAHISHTQAHKVGRDKTAMIPKISQPTLSPCAFLTSKAPLVDDRSIGAESSLGGAAIPKISGITDIDGVDGNRREGGPQ